MKDIKIEECLDEQSNEVQNDNETVESRQQEHTSDNLTDGQNETEKEDDSAEAQVSKLQSQVDEYKDKYLRQAAEFDNYRKRVIKEKADLIKNGGEKVISAILPILDDFERAHANMDKMEDIAAVKEGVELIIDKFLSILKKEGLEKIDVQGQPFNVDFHEAIAMVPAPTDELKGKVLDCVQTGYKLNEKVIRHAKVAVAE